MVGDIVSVNGLRINLVIDKKQHPATLPGAHLFNLKKLRVLASRQAEGLMWPGSTQYKP